MSKFCHAAAALSAFVAMASSHASVTFPIQMTGTQEVGSAGDPDGTGGGTITLDPDTNMISWNFTYANIAAPTLMHIHTGQDGASGGILINLGVATSGGAGTLISSTTTTAANITNILNNPQNFYVNVHNSPFPNGAVRGQIPHLFRVVMNGAQESPGPGDTDGSASGQLVLDTGTNTLSWNLTYSGIDAPTDMHIHEAQAGASGPVHIAMGAATSGGRGTLISSTGTTDSKLDAIIANPNEFYANIHTGDFPSGALRGQIVLDTSPGAISLPLVLNGGQESPGPGDPDGTATGTITFHPALESISWNLTYNNIKSPTLMHIHTGEDGASGPIFVGLDPVTNGGAKTLIGTATTSAANIQAILDNPVGYYVNIHNADFGGGAIRGQIPKSFDVMLTGGEEVPGPGDPDGLAHGTVLFDTGTDTVSWDIMYHDIAAPTLFHIHTGEAGVSGPIFIGLGVVTTGGPDTLKNSVGTSDANIDAILADPSGYYLNIHNSEFPGGALRGQIVAPMAVVGDLNGDHSVDGADLGLLLAAWDSADPDADLNDDGTVDGADLGLLLANWSI